MKHIFDGENYLIKLEKGEMLVESLIRFIKENDIKAGWISALGGLSWAELGFYDLNSKEYSWIRLDEMLELSNATGNIALIDGKPTLHLHATVAGADLRARAGHLKEAETAGTFEVMISPLKNQTKLTRSQDEHTGLSLLDI